MRARAREREREGESVYRAKSLVTCPPYVCLTVSLHISYSVGCDDETNIDP